MYTRERWPYGASIYAERDGIRTFYDLARKAPHVRLFWRTRPLEYGEQAAKRFQAHAARWYAQFFGVPYASLVREFKPAETIGADLSRMPTSRVLNLLDSRPSAITVGFESVQTIPSLVDIVKSDAEGKPPYELCLGEDNADSSIASIFLFVRGEENRARYARTRSLLVKHIHRLDVDPANIVDNEKIGKQNRESFRKALEFLESTKGRRQGPLPPL